MKKLTSPNLLLIGGPSDGINIRYLIGFSAPDPFLFLMAGTQRVLIVSKLEYGRAVSQVKKCRVLTPDDLKLNASARRDLGKTAVAALRQFGIKKLSLSPHAPAGILRCLEQNGLRVSIARPGALPDRGVKNQKELEAVEQSQKAAVHAMRRAIDVIRHAEIDGKGWLRVGRKQLTAEQVRSTIDSALLEKDCVAEETIVAAGDQGVDPHERGFGPLPAGQPIVLDIFPRNRTSGYWGDITRTVIRGTPQPEQKKLYRTVLRAQKQALDRVRPGVTGKAIHQEVDEFFKASGYQTGMVNGLPQGFFHGTGHGVGLEIHEQPGINLTGAALKEGQVITIEPGLYYHGLGGVRIEDTVAVTKTGYKMLAACNKVFEL